MKKRKYKTNQNVVKKRFMISFLGILCLPVSFFLIFFMQNFRDIYRTKIIEQAQNALISTGIELERNIDSLHNIVVYSEQNKQFKIPEKRTNYMYSEFREGLQAELATHPIINALYYYDFDYGDWVFSTKGIWSLVDFARICEGMNFDTLIELLNDIEKRQGKFCIAQNLEGDQYVQYIIRNSQNGYWVFVLSNDLLKQTLNMDETNTILLNQDEIVLYTTNIQDKDEYKNEYELTFEASDQSFKLIRQINEKLMFDELNDLQKNFFVIVIVILLIGGMLIMVLTYFNEYPIRNLLTFCKKCLDVIPIDMDEYGVFQYTVKTLEEKNALLGYQQKQNRLLLHLIYGRNCETLYFKNEMREVDLFQWTECYRVILIFAPNYTEMNCSKLESYFRSKNESNYEYQLIDIPVQGAIVVVVGMREEAEKNLEKELRRIANTIVDGIGEEIWFYVGMKCKEPKQIHLSYFQALSASRDHVPGDKGKIVYSKFEKVHNKKFLYPNEEISMLDNALIEADLDRAIAVSEQIIEILRSYSEEKADKQTDRIDMEKVLHFIEENKREADLNVSMVSDHFGESISYMSRRFKAYTNLNISDYISSIKFAYAGELLQKTDHSVKEIAVIIGYSTPISFIRKFKQLYGMTPIEYRDRENAKIQIDEQKRQGDSYYD